MNRSALAYIVTLKGGDSPPFVASCVIEQKPDGYRVLMDDGSGPRWFPREGLGQVTETDVALELDYQGTGQLGENGLKLEPVTVGGWNELAKLRPEMTPVFDFDDLADRLKGV